MFLPPTSEISHHRKVTNITMSPTSLSPYSDEIPWWTCETSILNGLSMSSFCVSDITKNIKRRNAEVKYMKKRVKRLKDNFYEELDDQDVLPDIEIFKFG